MTTCGKFSGATGTVWESRAGAPSQGGQPGWSDQNLAGIFFSAGGTDFAKYTAATNAWTTLAAIPVGVASWVSPQWIGLDDVYLLASGDVQHYSVATNTWSTLKTGLSTFGSSESAHDDAGNLYTLQTDGNIVKYNIATNTATTLTFGATGMSEPRMTWDSCTKKLFIAPGFASAPFFSFDPATSTKVTLASNPDGLVNDVFCGDRSGHVYAAGAVSGTQIWQYTTATNAWAKIPNLPIDHGFNGACTVTGDGYLYTTPSSAGAVNRIQLK